MNGTQHLATVLIRTLSGILVDILAKLYICFYHKNLNKYLKDGALAQQPLRQRGARQLARGLQLLIPVSCLPGNVLFVTKLRRER